MSHRDRRYVVMFMRGDKKTIVAPTENDAVRQCYRRYPETTSWDILKVERKENDN